MWIFPPPPIIAGTRWERNWKVIFGFCWHIVRKTCAWLVCIVMLEKREEIRHSLMKQTPCQVGIHKPFKIVARCLIGFWFSTSDNQIWPSLTFAELWVVWIHGAFATGVASQQGMLTLPDTCFRRPFWDLLVLHLLRPDSSNFSCLYSTFHLEYPLVLSRFCLNRVRIRREGGGVKILKWRRK